MRRHITCLDCNTNVFFWVRSRKISTSNEAILMSASESKAEIVRIDFSTQVLAGFGQHRSNCLSL